MIEFLFPRAVAKFGVSVRVFGLLAPGPDQVSRSLGIDTSPAGATSLPPVHQRTSCNISLILFSSDVTFYITHISFISIFLLDFRASQSFDLSLRSFQDPAQAPRSHLGIFRST